MKHKMLIAIFCLFMFSKEAEVSAQGIKLRDPFTPPFKEKTKTAVMSKQREPGHVSIPKEPLNVTVEGIIMSDSLKQAIVDGRVYKRGDVLKDKNARIIKINKTSVSFIYKGGVYEKFISKEKRRKNEE